MCMSSTEFSKFAVDAKCLQPEKIWKLNDIYYDSTVKEVRTYREIWGVRVSRNGVSFGRVLPKRRRAARHTSKMKKTSMRCPLSLIFTTPSFY